MDQSLELLFYNLWLVGLQVSILILVDQSLELRLGIILMQLITSFNPYFSGSVTGTNQTY
ncbi:MAG: hypothetical protein CI949_3381 [Halanaerobium sp.]|nr:MAG: hypothetical protein CI949_3381 [Halanaerobium sp.]